MSRSGRTSASALHGSWSTAVGCTRSSRPTLHAGRRRRTAGKADLFDAEGPRTAGVIERSSSAFPTSTRRAERLAPAARRSTPTAACTAGPVPDSRSGSSSRGPGRRSRPRRPPGPDPDDHRVGLAELGLEREGGRLRVADERVVCRRRGCPRASDRCSTTSRSSSTPAEDAERGGATRGLEVDRVVDAPNTLAVFVWGPDGSSSSTSSTSRASRSSEPPCPTSSSPGPAWPASSRRREARELRRRVARPREGRPAGRLDAALERGRLAAPRPRRLPARVPRRRPGAPAPPPRAARRRPARGWRSSARRSSRGTTGNPRTTGVRFDTRALTDGARPGRPASSGSASRCASCPASAARPRHGRLPGRTASSCAARDARSGPPAPARDAVEHGGRAPARARSRARRPAPGSTSSTAATCPRRRRASGEPSSSGWRSSTRARRSTARTGERFATGRGRRSTSCSGPRGQPGARARTGRRRARSESACATAPSRDMIDAAEGAGAPRPPRRTAAVEVWRRGITTTLGGLRVDDRAQAAPGVFAAGGDAGGIVTGGYASGLAAALVLGRVAAGSALEAPVRSYASASSTPSPSGSRRSCCSSTRRRYELSPVAARCSRRWTRVPPTRGPRGATRPRSSCARPPVGSAADAVAGARGPAGRRHARGRRSWAPGSIPPRGLGDAPLVDCRPLPRGDGEMRGLIARTPELRAPRPRRHARLRARRSGRSTRCASYLPLLQGLAPTARGGSASTPGLASARCALARAYPGRGVPRAPARTSPS